eukprot:scaffold2727_cov275-Chaetoceros_neogracile.AAC.39
MSQSAMVRIVSAVCSVSGRPLNEMLSCALLEGRVPFYLIAVHFYNMSKYSRYQYLGRRRKVIYEGGWESWKHYFVFSPVTKTMHNAKVDLKKNKLPEIEANSTIN